MLSSELADAVAATGGSLEALTQSLLSFQRDVAFAEIAAMPEGCEQTARAMELFGRDANQILAVIKETKWQREN